ncbi:MAG: pseudouridine synthase [Cyanobacteria bacterium RI_101]|nr:pseudouridine synthase [Cyanobacteria bacterium RI_101]
MFPDTILFYKPYGVLCQFTDPDQRRSTLKDFIPIPDLYPVGRLDFDSEGLLLLTRQGRLQHRLAHPRFAQPRTYWAQVEGSPQESGLQPLREGVLIQNYRTRPAQVRLLDPAPEVPPRDPPIRYRKTVPTAWLELVLTEGKNRQVRRMSAAVGFPTLRLIRVAHRVSSDLELNLEELPPGEWRALTEQENVQLTRLAF